MRLTVTTLDTSTWHAFAEFVERNSGILEASASPSRAPLVGRRGLTDNPESTRSPRTGAVSEFGVGQLRGALVRSALA
jgi:hypothetical protein